MPDLKNRLREEAAEPHGVSLKAVDVLQQTFTVKFRGYDSQDVDSFLEVVAREMERLTQQNMQLIDELRSTRQDLALLRKKEENVNAALLTVQRLAEETREKTQAESARLLEEAGNEAGQIVESARKTAQAQQEEAAMQRGRFEKEAAAHVDAARQEAERILNTAHEKASQRHAEADTIKSQAQDQARALLDSTRREADALLEQTRTKSAELQEAAACAHLRAEQEARMIIDKARAESAGLDEKLQQAQQQLRDDITRLRQNKIQLETSFRALIETHLKLMEGNGKNQQSE